MMTNLRQLPVLLMALVLVGNGALLAATAAGGGTVDVLAGPAPRADTVFYMNKTGSTPNIDSTWDSIAWQKGRAYDLSNGQGKCIMYIMFTAGGAGFTKLFIGIDVIGDTVSANNGYLAIGLDGDNDGKVTYENTDPDGGEAGVVWPHTYGGPSVDRWAQIYDDSANNQAGWMLMWGTVVQRWQVTGGGESQDGMGSGYAAHRFYEYSTDYSRNLGLGEDDVFGLNIKVNDAYVPYQLPANYGSEGGPFVKFALAQAPVAVIRSPLANGYYYKDDNIDFDGSDSTDDEYAGLRYQWSFDDGASADTRQTTHSFTTVGRHTVSLEVTDPDGHNDTTSAVFFIKQKNVAPAIKTFHPLLDPVINETELITFEVNLDDANYNQSVGESVWVNWTLDDKRVRTGLAYPKSNYTFKTDYDGAASAGVYYVNVTVQDTYDGGAPEPTFHGWVVTVNNLNRPPLVTVVEPDVDQLSVAEAGSLSLHVEYMDPDGDNVTAQWYADNETLPGTKNKDTITWQPDHNSSGTHEVKVSLTDRNGGLTERGWTVVVTNVDRPPAITSAAPSQAELSVKEGAGIKFSIVRFDPDMEPLTAQWYVDTTPVPGTNSTTFNFNATYEGALSSEGSPYTIKVVVKDPFGLSTDRSWQLTVEDVNRLPVAIIDQPSEEEDFGLGETVKVRGDRSWDPDAEDNGSLQYVWDFGDGKTGNGPSGSHKYDQTGPYTIRLTVKDRSASSSAFVHVNIRAPVLWVTDLLITPTVNIREDRTVNITVRLSNTGDADATDLLVKLSVDNMPIATQVLESLPSQERDDVLFTWTAVKGDHTLRASIEPASGIIVPDGSASEKTVTVKAKPQPVAEGFPAWMIAVAAAFVVVIVLAVVGYSVLSRRRKTPRPVAERSTDGKLSPDAALAAITGASPPAVLAGTGAVLEQAATGQAAAMEPGTPAAGPPEAAPIATPEGAAPAAEPAAPPGPAAPAVEAPAESAAVAAATAGTVPAAAPMEAAAPAAAAPFTAEAAREAPVAAPVCPSCGEPLEPAWKLCPACGTKLEGPEAPPPPAPAAAVPAGAAPSEFSEEVAGIRKRIEVLTAMDKDVSALQSTLDLATSFHRTGKEEKAQKYLDKARQILAELDQG